MNKVLKIKKKQRVMGFDRKYIIFQFFSQFESSYGLVDYVFMKKANPKFGILYELAWRFLNLEHSKIDEHIKIFAKIDVYFVYT